MLESFKNIFAIPDLRKKVFYTLLMIAITRIGVHIPTPFVDSEAVNDFFRNSQGGIFGIVDMFTGGGFQNMSIMVIGIMPYISAQIILQLMMVVVPALEKMRKEGEAGQKRIEQYTRYGAIGLATIQAIGVVSFMVTQGFVVPSLADSTFLFIPGWLIFCFIGVLAIVTGTAILMWIGEQITANGIGNGISLIIALGILASYPSATYLLFQAVSSESIPRIWLPIILGLGIVTTALIVMIQEGARRIPIQHARRTVGRRVQQGTTNYLPLKVNTAGVIPVIFSSAILGALTTLTGWLSSQGANNFAYGLGALFIPTSPYNPYDFFGMERESIFLLLRLINPYVLIDASVIVFFCFFYTAVTFNPGDVADNLKKAGAFVPGFSPGKQTADYIDRVLTRITTVGALFLVVVALIPLALNISYGLNYNYAQFAGGTGLIIIVGVVLDTMKKIESELLMHNYEGFRSRRQAEGSRRRYSGSKALNT
ncbi:MAG: preprotein translocase subunit SecY [Candidatus Sumerlaeia bacterium]|nr:preprotein translocase subunit SecY [Candidatus Sumerlaeia bacterium]